jgi:hypothetical protein
VTRSKAIGKTDIERIQRQARMLGTVGTRKMLLYHSMLGRKMCPIGLHKAVIFIQKVMLAHAAPQRADHQQIVQVHYFCGLYRVGAPAGLGWLAYCRCGYHYCRHFRSPSNHLPLPNSKATIAKSKMADGVYRIFNNDSKARLPIYLSVFIIPFRILPPVQLVKMEPL